MPTNTTLQPFYANPHTDDVQTQRNDAMQIFPAIIDPFTAVHIYTALLPIAQLKLPPWILSTQLKNIASFFKIGPLLLPSDVPACDDTKVVTENYKLDDPAMQGMLNGEIELPNVGLADWGWLQPYYDYKDLGYGNTKYNILDVKNQKVKPTWTGGPATAVEGYLQMKKGFGAPAANE